MKTVVVLSYLVGEVEESGKRWWWMGMVGPLEELN